MIWDSGYTNSINPYVDLNTKYRSLEPTNTIELIGIGGSAKPNGIVIIVLDIEDDNDNTHKIII